MKCDNLFEKKVFSISVCLYQILIFFKIANNSKNDSTFYFFKNILYYFLSNKKVEFSPTLLQLATITGDIGKTHLIKAISDVRRLPDLLTKKRSTKDVSYLSVV